MKVTAEDVFVRSIQTRVVETLNRIAEYIERDQPLNALKLAKRAAEIFSSEKF